jgi:predicted transcriptional regulator
MYEPINKSSLPLHVIQAFTKTVLKYRNLQSADLSQTQIRYLIYLSTFNPPILKREICAKFGISIQNSKQFNFILIQTGYLYRIKYGQYDFTPKGSTFITSFLKDYQNRLDRPFSWI